MKRLTVLLALVLLVFGCRNNDNVNNVKGVSQITQAVAGSTTMVESWNTMFNWSSGSDMATASTTDSSGNLYVGGLDSVDGNQDWRLLKLDPEGNQLWTTRYAFSSGPEYVLGMAVDSIDNIYAVGSHMLTSPDSQWKILKLDPSGNVISSFVFNLSSGFDYARSVTVDSDDDVYVVGPENATSLSDVKGRLLKLDSSGNTLLNITLDSILSIDRIVPWGVAVDASKNIYVVGKFGSTSGSNGSAFLVKLGQTGSVVWLKTFNTENYDELRSVALDQDGNIYVVGYIDYVFQTQGDAKAIKLSSSGDIVWEKTYSRGGSYPDIWTDISVDTKNRLVFVGVQDMITASSKWLVLRSNSSGDILWENTYNWTAPEDAQNTAFTVSVGPSDSVYVGGQDESPGDFQWRVLKLVLPPPVIDSTADIKGSATIGDGTTIGANVTIWPKVVIGEECAIGAGSDIKSKVEIGDVVEIGINVVIYPQVSVGYGTVVGDGTVIKAGAIVGKNCQIGQNVTISPQAVVPDGTVIQDGATF